MRKYQGEVIHQSHDPLGVIEVVEDNLSRSLHFGTDARQSSMLLRDPYQLSLSYTRAMCAALLFCEEPRRVLLLGLGGGSLAKFLLHYYPQCHIDAVEFRPEVHQIAHRYFALPEGPRLHVIYDDAGRFVRQHPIDQAGYDLILIDAFLDKGIAHSVCGSSFFAACHDLLTAEGVLSMNLWSDDRVQANDFIEDMGLSFEQQALRLPVEGKANVIGIATRQAAARKQLRGLDDRARRLELHTTIEFTALLHSLRKLNKRFF